MQQFGDIYRGKRVLLTGHTGFKGSWLALWLHNMGALVTGVSLASDGATNHFELLDLDVKDLRVDVRDIGALTAVFDRVMPEIVFHLAAQPLVRRSYKDPLETWSTNVMGTANILELSRKTDTVRSVVVITTDKCYENFEWPWGYRETDRLGGHDPYSASKAGAELVVSSYRKSFFGVDGAPLVATARAGNVIGGGDWSEDRLVPDLIRSVINKDPLTIRSPNSTRPWQHVLDSLCGYLMLGERLLAGDKSCADSWNFGPEAISNVTVQNVLLKIQAYWPEIKWSVGPEAELHEGNLLYLDSSKARSSLGWNPILTLDAALLATTDWYQSYVSGELIVSKNQLNDYFLSALKLDAKWIRP